MDVVFRQKGTVSTAAEHGVRVHFTKQLGAGFDDDAWQPDDTVQFSRFCRQLGRSDDVVARDAFLDGEEVIAAHGSHQKSRDGGGVFTIGGHIVFHKIKKLALAAADGFEEIKVFIAEPLFKVVITLIVLVHARVEHFHEIRIPSVVLHKKRGPHMAQTQAEREKFYIITKR